MCKSKCLSGSIFFLPIFCAYKYSCHAVVCIAFFSFKTLRWVMYIISLMCPLFLIKHSMKIPFCNKQLGALWWQFNILDYIKKCKVQPSFLQLLSSAAGSIWAFIWSIPFSRVLRTPRSFDERMGSTEFCVHFTM